LSGKGDSAHFDGKFRDGTRLGEADCRVTPRESKTAWAVEGREFPEQSK